MRTHIYTVKGDPILEKGTMKSAGKEVPAGVHYDRIEYGMVRSNLTVSGNEPKLVAYTSEMRQRVLEDLTKCYTGDDLIQKMKEFDLIKLGS